MGPITITMTGADEAHYVEASALSSRVIVFPDGMARHFTFRNVDWEVVDSLTTVRGWDPDAFARLCYESAMQFWLPDVFNIAAAPGIHQRFLENASDLECRYTPERAQFEWRLRRSVASMIRVNAADRANLEAPANEF